MSVEESSPMKRGLKRWVYVALIGSCVVEESSPMKRGLKPFSEYASPGSEPVEESSPMKRGLKRINGRPVGMDAGVLSRCPR